MDWNKAKTLTIIFLLSLNAFLGFLIYLERDKYNIDSQRINTIVDLLEKNDIIINTSIPRSYRPAQQLAMSAYYYDEIELLYKFFKDLEDADDVDMMEERDIGRKTFEYGSGAQKQTLTLQNGFITFNRPPYTNDFPWRDDDALLDEASYFLIDMGEISDFVPDSIFVDEEEGNSRVRFCQMYNNKIIYSNFIEFWVNEKGIFQIDCIYSSPKGLFGQPADLCAVDEVLLHFMQRYKDAYGDKHAEILRIDLVYYQKEGSLIDSGSLTAVPHYRIVVDEFERPFLFNAYLNLMEQF
jgi:hypothetical protein